MSVAIAKPPRSTRAKPKAARGGASTSIIPEDVSEVELQVDGRDVKLTNLGKPFWPELGITKGDLLRYYADVSPYLVPHLRDRAMVMKRYPHGAHGEFFFQKRAPEHRPEWIEVCSIEHASESVIDFPIVRDLSSLLWIVNLGCIDLNQWYARCGDVQRPDYVHFDLDPTDGATWEQVCETALVVHDALEALKMPNFAKTTGSRGIHIYVPIVYGPVQKTVWAFAKQFAQSMESLHPKLITSEYRIAKRPKNHVLVDYNQNAWGRTLASVYSVRPKPEAPVSTPVTWQEVGKGIEIEDFTLRTVPARLNKVGDLWKPLLHDQAARFNLENLL
jgi:bifunctional non-homologous end joining protein LigD